MLRALRVSPVIAMLLASLSAIGCSSESREPEQSGQGNPQKPIVGLDDGNPLKPGSHDTDRIVTPGIPVSPQLPEAQKQELDRIEQEIQISSSMTPQQFATTHAVAHLQALPYEPSSASNLSTIQNSALKLQAAELAILNKNGFVISERHKFPSFAYGYKSIYLADLPVYVSADSILSAVHRSYDDILKWSEHYILRNDVSELLTRIRTKLPAYKSKNAAAAADLDFYVGVALSLLSGKQVDPVAGGDSNAMGSFVASAKAAEGASKAKIFGVDRDIDFSQFTPRGHYTETEELQRYFQCMMWLGRIDMRILETQPDHTQVFHRRQLEAAFALREVIDGPALERWERVDSVIRAFVGEPDSMTLKQLDSLLLALHIPSADDLGKVSDADIAQAILAGGFGTQRISSHIMINGLDSGTMPLSSTFLLLGQRYVLDSHVFSNVVYDRVKAKRMMPNPLDVAFAALQNDDGGKLLQPELEKFGYTPSLHMMRVLAEAHGQEYWGANLYNTWLSALRALSPTESVAAPLTRGLPSVTGTEAWGRRILNTQLASWAELRHDTILYVKQSYTAGAACSFPDAYVDPYPELFAKLHDFAVRGEAVAELLVGSSDAPGASDFASRVRTYFMQLDGVVGQLKAMAESEIAGTPLTAAQLAFINEAVDVVPAGCTADQVQTKGWYSRLFFDVGNAAQFDPTIADVHTQPTDESGNMVGRILHVGTGMPRLLVTTVDTCSGVHSYVGLTSSYFEETRDQFKRLTDEDWQTALKAETPADVPWMSDLVAR